MTEQSKSAFSSRPAGYKAGMVFLFLSTALFIVGYASPFWVTTTLDNVVAEGLLKTLNVEEGLWMMCVNSKTVRLNISSSSCHYLGVANNTNWLHGTRTLVSSSLIGLVLACVYSLFINFCYSGPVPHPRILEAAAATSGFLGFTGCMLYADYRSTEVDAYTNRAVQQLQALRVLNVPAVYSFFWAFYFTIFGSTFCIVATIILAIFNNKRERPVMVVEPAAPDYGGPAIIALPNVIHGQGYSGQPNAPITSIQ